MKRTVALLFAVILASTISFSGFQADKYLNIIDRMDDAYGHFMDDLCGMMEIASRFREDPDYNYDPSDMELIVMRDGVNGTQELVDLYEELMNVTESDIEAWKAANITSADLDGDGLGGEVESEIGSDPLNWDTDGDGLSDGLEYVMNLGMSTTAAPIPQVIIALILTALAIFLRGRNWK